MPRPVRFTLRGMMVATMVAAALAYYAANVRTPVHERNFSRSTSGGRATLMQYGVSRRRLGGEDHLQYLIISKSSEPWRSVTSISLSDVEDRVDVSSKRPSAPEACPIYEVVDGTARFVGWRRISLKAFEGYTHGDCELMPSGSYEFGDPIQ